jgi:hypothetical protein
MATHGNSTQVTCGAFCYHVAARSADQDGRLLSLLLKWREERKETLGIEISRLQNRLAEAIAGKQTETPIEEELMEWLTANGAQVRFRKC